MKLLKLRKAQSLIEYAILLAVVISAFLLLQGIVKRGVSGGINDAASRMGEQYSVTNTATLEKRTMTDGDQYIIEETGTKDDDTLTKVLTSVEMADVPVKGSIDLGAHNLTQRLKQNFTSETRVETDAASQETYKFDEAALTTVTDFDQEEPRGQGEEEEGGGERGGGGGIE